MSTMTLPHWRAGNSFQRAIELGRNGTAFVAAERLCAEIRENGQAVDFVGGVVMFSR